MSLEKIFSNPVISKMALSSFKNDLDEKQCHGIYVYFDNGVLKTDYFKEHPALTILKNSLNQNQNNG